MQTKRYNFNRLVRVTLAIFILLTIPMTLRAQFGGGQGIAIFGPNTATAGTTENYSLFGPSDIVSVNWSTSHGATVLSSSNVNAVIRFDSPGTRTISAFAINTFNNFYTDDYTVNVAAGIPSAPPNPTVAFTNCGVAALQRTGSPPSGVTWYWQGKTSNGTSITMGSGSSFSANQGNGYYYIRARSSSNQWSTASARVYVSMQNFQPGSIGGAQTVCYGGNPSTLGNSSSASGGNFYSYQWQQSSSGSGGWSNINGATSTSYNPPAGLTADRYYQRKVVSCGQTKYSNVVKVTVDPGQVYYYDTDGDGFGNPSNSVRTCSSQPSGTVSNASDYNDGTRLITNIAPQTWYKDVDGDGYGDNSATLTASFKRLGWADNNLDQCPDIPGAGNGCDPIPLAYSDENYVTVKNYQDPNENGVIENISYFDGLGRKKQDVAVKASGTGMDKSPNLAPGWSMDWTVGTGSTSFFNQNGATVENNRVQAPDPFGRLATIWECGNQPDNSADGGWNTDYFNVDKTKTYRYTVWVKRNHSHDGRTYHGTQNVNNLSGSANGNPYFIAGEDLPQLDTWYLLVGIIHPYTHGSTDTGVSGIYDIQGNKVDDGYEFKWSSSTTESRFRSYLYYCTDVNVRQYFYEPMLEVVDGNELPLQKFFDNGKSQDLVAHVEYDDYGRTSEQHLPYVQYGNNGNFKNGAKTATESYHTEFFGADINPSAPNPYSETQYEASPLNRVLKQAAPGYDWRMGGGHEMVYAYQTNVANEVRFFEVTFSGNNTESPQLAQDGYYLPKELYKTVTYDENHTSGTNHSSEEFKNKRGQVVLKRTFNNGPHDTYYVYDEFGNLTYVIPPKVTTASVSTTELNELCYQYRYDHRNRLIEKRLPGWEDWEEIVYNKLDQPIMTRDPNLKANGEWLFTKYDAFGRVVYTGKANLNQTRAQAQASADATTAQYESYFDEFYTTNTYPSILSTSHELLTVQFYDHYDVDLAGYTIPTTVLDQTVAQNVKGLPTIIGTKVLGSGDPGEWVHTLTLYDEKGRAILVGTLNDHLQTFDTVETELDFTRRPIQVVSTHIKGTNAPIVTTDNFTYDHMGRLIKQEQTIGSHTETIVENTYDELGQLAQKKVGGGLQTVNYEYNVRGWLKQINNPNSLGDDLFAFGINYNTASHSGFPLYNGNIAETEWRTGNADNGLKWYRYSYDALNRIESAIGSNTNYDLVNVDYDMMGNITALNRRGHTNSGATSFGTMDNLVYNYHNSEVSNRLYKVNDTGNASYGFIDSPSNNQDYWYDDNGNMTRDLNKGIGTATTDGITYNHLNLPTNIWINGNGNNGTIGYIYDATGSKLKKTVSTGSTLEYASGYVYENGTLQFFNHPEGYIKPNGIGGYDYVYQYTDHLGNIRLSYTEDPSNPGTPTIIEENNYYPFGLKHRGYNAGGDTALGNDFAQRWKYNGMELDESLGLETYDFGARNYDPALGRWMNIDPLAEQMRRHSPYNYAYNNPVSFVDPDGMLGQAAWASSFGVSLNVLGSMFTESEAAVQRQQRQAIYDAINGELNGDSEGEDDSVTEELAEGECDDCSKCPETCTNPAEGPKTYLLTGSVMSRTATSILDGMPTTVPNQRFIDFSQLEDLAKQIKGIERVQAFKLNSSILTKGFALGSVGLDVGLYASGKQSGLRTAYRLTGTGVAVGVGYAVSAPASLLVTGAFYAGEQYYDGVQYDRNFWSNNRKVLQSHSIDPDTNEFSNRAMEHFLSGGEFD